MKPIIYIISESITLTDFIVENLEKSYDFTVFRDPYECMTTIPSRMPETIIMDMEMEGFTFYMFGERLSKKNPEKYIGLIGIVSNGDEIEGQFFNTMDYIRTPINISELSLKLYNMHDLYVLKKLLNSAVKYKLDMAPTGSNILFKMLEEKEFRGSKYNSRHIERMREYARLILKDISVEKSFGNLFNKNKMEQIFSAITYHDLGNQMVSEDILLKEDVLTDSERAEMQRHIEYGLELAEKELSTDKKLVFCYDTIKSLIKYHHEREDGSGYPFGLKSDEIPVEAKVIAVIDTFDGLTTEKPYKKAVSPSEAQKFIVDNSGVLFDERVVQSFLRCYDKFEEICETVR